MATTKKTATKAKDTAKKTISVKIDDQLQETLDYFRNEIESLVPGMKPTNSTVIKYAIQKAAKLTQTDKPAADETTGD